MNQEDNDDTSTHRVVENTTASAAAEEQTSLSSVCLGTRRVSVLFQSNRDDQVSQPGIVAAFRRIEDEDDKGSCVLEVVWSDAERTLVTRIHPDNDTKVQWRKVAEERSRSHNVAWNDADKVNVLASYLLCENNDNEKKAIAVSYEEVRHASDDGQVRMPTVRLIVRETLPGGIVRILLSKELQPTQPDASPLTFACMIGDSLNQKMEQIKSLEKDKANLFKWKDTAEKLDGEWQRNKDSLLDRFLVLYRKTHGELRKALEEIDKLKQRPTSAGAAKSTAAGQAKNAVVPFDFSIARDVDMYDSTTVDRLARGERHTQQEDALDQKHSASGSTGGSDSAGTRINPVSGAMEVWNLDDLLDEHQGDTGTDEESTDEPNAKRARLEDV